MAVRVPAYEEAVEHIAELEEELDALLLLRERAASDTGGRHALADIARSLVAEDLLGR
jgi:hypothetical protein